MHREALASVVDVLWDEKASLHVSFQDVAWELFKISYENFKIGEGEKDKIKLYLFERSSYLGI